MSPRTGRPVEGKPLTNDVKVRLDDDTNAQLLEYCTKHDVSKAEAIRQGICLLLKTKK